MNQHDFHLLQSYDVVSIFCIVFNKIHLSSTSAWNRANGVHRRPLVRRWEKPDSHTDTEQRSHLTAVFVKDDWGAWFHPFFFHHSAVLQPRQPKTMSMFQSQGVKVRSTLSQCVYINPQLIWVQNKTLDSQTSSGLFTVNMKTFLSSVKKNKKTCGSCGDQN